MQKNITNAVAEIGWDCHILAFSSLYNSDLTSGLADPCKIMNCTSELPAANMTMCCSKLNQNFYMIDTTSPLAITIMSL